MESDPDFIDPAELRERAEVSGGAGAVSSRPTVRRTEEAAPVAEPVVVPAVGVMPGAVIVGPARTYGAFGKTVESTLPPEYSPDFPGAEKKVQNLTSVA